MRSKFPSGPFWTAILAAVGFLVSILPGQALDKVVLQLKWQHQFQFAGYYAAIAQGYYREAGLEVELREARPGQKPEKEVLEGRADFGVGTSNILLLRAQGKPVVVLAVIYQHSPFILLSTKASGVRDIHDLAERKIMMEPDAAELLAYFKHEGVDPATLQIVPHSFDAMDLTRNEIAGMSAYSTDEPLTLQEAGIETLIFSPRSAGIDFYGDNLYTTERQIARHPERVRAFLAASLRGWDYAMKNQEEMVDLILRDYAVGKTRPQLLFEAAETTRLVHPDLIALGYVNPGRWQAMADTYALLGMIPKAFSLDGFLFEANPRPDLRWVWIPAAGLFLLLIALSAWSLVTTRMNRNLRAEIAARKAAEGQVRSQSAAKTHFLAVLAHEVRSPLSGILSSLWLYRSSESDAEKSELIEIAEESASNLLRMVDNILDQAKLETGNMVTESLKIPVREFLAEIIKLFGAAAATKSVPLKLELGPEMPEIIYSDPTRLRQILSNLVSNAVKFTAKGSVRVLAQTSATEEGQPSITFQVIDSGPGMTAGQVARIFEPYSQADATVAREHGGTGLGLSISTQLATLLGGSLRVETAPGQGSTFSLIIPREKPLT